MSVKDTKKKAEEKAHNLPDEKPAHNPEPKEEDDFMRSRFYSQDGKTELFLGSKRVNPNSKS